MDIADLGKKSSLQLRSHGHYSLRWKARANFPCLKWEILCFVLLDLCFKAARYSLVFQKDAIVYSNYLPVLFTYSWEGFTLLFHFFLEFILFLLFINNILNIFHIFVQFMIRFLFRKQIRVVSKARKIEVKFLLFVSSFLSCLQYIHLLIIEIHEFTWNLRHICTEMTIIIPYVHVHIEIL